MLMLMLLLLMIMTKKENDTVDDNWWCLLYTSRGTWRCPGWPMAKPDSNFVYHITKKGDGINCENVSE